MEEDALPSSWWHLLRDSVERNLAHPSDYYEYHREPQGSYALIEALTYTTYSFCIIFGVAAATYLLLDPVPQVTTHNTFLSNHATCTMLSQYSDNYVNVLSSYKECLGLLDRTDPCKHNMAILDSPVAKNPTYPGFNETSGFSLDAARNRLYVSSQDAGPYYFEFLGMIFTVLVVLLLKSSQRRTLSEIASLAADKCRRTLDNVAESLPKPRKAPAEELSTFSHSVSPSEDVELSTSSQSKSCESLDSTACQAFPSAR